MSRDFVFSVAALVSIGAIVTAIVWTAVRKQPISRAVLPVLAILFVMLFVDQWLADAKYASAPVSGWTPPYPGWEPPDPFKGVTKLLISVALLACSLFVILSNKYGPKDKHWAYAAAGTVVGFWLSG